MEIEELWDEENYTQLFELEHEELIPFIQQEFGYHTGVVRFYLILNIAILAGMIAWGTWQVIAGIISFGTILQYVGLGIVLSMTFLIPVHEGIHGLAYKLVGAPRVSYGGSLRRFYFYAVADRYVLNTRDFRLVALAPFVVITFFTLVAIFYVSLNCQWLLLGVLLMHTGACAGDFGMISFYARQQDKEIFTYDQVKEKVTFFFAKNQ